MNLIGYLPFKYSFQTLGSPDLILSCSQVDQDVAVHCLLSHTLINDGCIREGRTYSLNMQN